MKSMALAEQTEFAFMKAAKGTDVPKPEVIELDEHIDAYKKKYGLTEEEVIEILRSFAPPKAKQNNEGGLQEQGGTKDPVSGNDVPIGSLKEEVRDDIPAMLSEGEFVFPADVTRYYGLDTLMKMRQKAKQGLKVMEAMGQMGNSEEATIPDDIPFDMDDLELAEGGVVEAQQGIYMSPEVNPPAVTLQPGFGTAPQLGPTSPLPNVGGYTPPPIADTTPKSFSDLMGTAGYDELRPYVNEQGQQMQIPFKDGKPIRPIPEGFKPRDASADTTVRPTFTTATDTTQSSTDRPAVPQTVEQQQTADDLLLGKEEDLKRGEVTPAVRGVAPKSADAFETKDFQDYLRVRSPSGSMGIDYASGKNTKTFALDPVPTTKSNTALPLLGKAGDVFDRGVSMALPGPLVRQSDRAIRRKAADRLLAGEYRDATDYNTLRNIIDLEPKKPLTGKLALFPVADDEKLTSDIKEIKEASKHKYSSKKAEKFKKTEADFNKNLEIEQAKNPSTSNQEMTRMMITQNPTRDSAIMSGESNSEREARERREADAMQRAAAMDAQIDRENRRRAEAALNNDDNQNNNTGGSTFSEPTATGTHCCTASYKQKTMTISEVKELRRWHRQQSQIWQDGYDVWGKYVADGLVAKSKWQASVVKSVHDLLIKKKLTLKGIYGMIVISSGVYPIGLFKRITKYGRIFQST
jgi:hypothetical protein